MSCPQSANQAPNRGAGASIRELVALTALVVPSVSAYFLSSSESPSQASSVTPERNVSEEVHVGTTGVELDKEALVPPSEDVVAKGKPPYGLPRSLLVQEQQQGKRQVQGLPERFRELYELEQKIAELREGLLVPPYTGAVMFQISPTWSPRSVGFTPEIAQQVREMRLDALERGEQFQNTVVDVYECKCDPIKNTFSLEVGVIGVSSSSTVGFTFERKAAQIEGTPLEIRMGEDPAINDWVMSTFVDPTGDVPKHFSMKDSTWMIDDWEQEFVGFEPLRLRLRFSGQVVQNEL